MLQHVRTRREESPPCHSNFTGEGERRYIDLLQPLCPFFFLSPPPPQPQCPRRGTKGDYRPITTSTLASLPPLPFLRCNELERRGCSRCTVSRRGGGVRTAPPATSAVTGQSVAWISTTSGGCGGDIEKRPLQAGSRALITP